MDSIDKYLIISNFDSLPINYKRSFLIRTFEVNEDEDWMYYLDGISKINWKNEKLVKKISEKLSHFFINRKFAYGNVPIELIKQKVMNSSELSDFENFEEYHKSYGNFENHGKSIWPILVSDKDEEYIIDGWHRFHYYCEINLASIPVLKYI